MGVVGTFTFNLQHIHMKKSNQRPKKSSSVHSRLLFKPLIAVLLMANMLSPDILRLATEMW